MISKHPNLKNPWLNHPWYDVYKNLCAYIYMWYACRTPFGTKRYKTITKTVPNPWCGNSTGNGKRGSSAKFLVSAPVGSGPCSVRCSGARGGHWYKLVMDGRDNATSSIPVRSKCPRSLASTIRKPLLLYSTRIYVCALHLYLYTYIKKITMCLFSLLNIVW